MNISSIGIPQRGIHDEFITQAVLKYIDRSKFPKKLVGKKIEFKIIEAESKEAEIRNIIDEAKLEIQKTEAKNKELLSQNRSLLESLRKTI